MKWYFASRMRHKDKINNLGKVLESYGQEISFNWAEIGSVKPYSKNKEACMEYSYSVSSAIKDSDVFVMISDKEGTDMFTEKGLAISSNMDKGTPRIYVVGKYNSRSMMHFHSSIKRVNSIEDVFREELPEVLKDGILLPRLE
jgi:Sec7-like guanine-nucleotide exchange factor